MLPVSPGSMHPLPKFIHLHARNWFTFPEPSNMGHVTVDANLQDAQGAEQWLSDTHVIAEHTCWNYGHWLLDSLIPTHRVLRSLRAASRHRVRNVTVWNAKANNLDTCDPFYEDGLVPGFHFRTLTKSPACFDTLVTGFSIEWGLEFQYHPGQYRGPDAIQYRQFRDSFVSGFRSMDSFTSVRGQRKRVLLCSRNDGRKVRNERALANFLQQRLGAEWLVESISFDGLTQSEQGLRMQSADMVVGMAGSNLLNSVYGKDGLKVIEILPARMHDFHTGTFAKMPYLCHAVYRATMRETVFNEGELARASHKYNVVNLLTRQEDWQDEGSVHVWHKLASVEVDLDRFWQHLGRFVAGVC